MLAVNVSVEPDPNKMPYRGMSSTYLLATIFGIAAFISLAYGQASEHQRAMNINKGCPLRPQLPHSLCFPSGSILSMTTVNSAQSDDDNVDEDEDLDDEEDEDDGDEGNEMINPEVETSQDDEGTVFVSEGVECFSSVETSQAFKCRNGAWLLRKLPRELVDEVNEIRSGQTTLVRRKRLGFIRKIFRKAANLVSKVVTKTVCWVLKCRVVTYGGGNTNPTIFCPVIGNDNLVYTTHGNTQALVTWSPAEAHDQEDGTISTTLTAGPHSGTWLDESDVPYNVSYIARDSNGGCAICTTSFFVKARRCNNNMDSLSNGHVTCTTERIVGSTCTFTCDQGYELSGGDVQVTCEEDLHWEGTKPRCIEFSCPSPPEVQHGAWVGCSLTQAGSHCTLVCDDGFTVQGNLTITCLSRTEWSGEGTCVDIRAPMFNCPDDVITFSAAKKQPISVSWVTPDVTDNSNDVIEVTSSHTSGDLFPVGDNIVTFRAEDSAGNVRSCNTTISVEVKRCGVLPAIQLGSITCSHERAYGSVCVYSCSAGLHLEGVSERMCLDTQDWSHSQPSCQRDNCGTPPAVSKGEISCSNGTLFESTCTVTCQQGYALIGPVVITCNASTQWTSAGTCQDREPPEFPLGCPEEQMEAAPLGQVTYLSYDLPQAIDSSNDPVAVTGDPPEGTAVAVGVVDVSVVAMDTAGNSANCTMAVRVERGECGDPYNSGIDKSQDQLLEYSCPDGHVHGATCQLTCSDNNPVQGGVTSITCEKTAQGSEFEWSTGNVDPYCEDQQCARIEPPTYGATSCSTVAERTLCALQCQRGYAYPNIQGQTAESFYCDASSGEWIPAVVSTDVCLRGRPPQNVNMMPDIYYYDSPCTEDLTEIKENFAAIINDSSILVGLCGQSNVTCEVKDVDVECGDDSGRRRRAVNASNPEHDLVKRQTNTLKARWTIQMVFDDSETSRAKQEELVNAINSAYYDNSVSGKYNMPEAGTTNSFSYGNGVLTNTCEGARQPRNTDPDYPFVCVPCGKGLYLPSSGGQCEKCPVGSYQPLEEASTCTPCPGDATTKDTASTDLSDCLDLCLTGHYSIGGRESCDLCPVGTYQSDRGKRTCDNCPFGWSTSGRGATSVENCTLYEIKFTENATSNVTFTSSSKAFTFLTFVRSPTDLANTMTTFSLTPDPDVATLWLGGVKVYINRDAGTGRTRREFSHMAVVYDDGDTRLYMNGQFVESSTGHFVDQQLFFTSGSNVEELLFSGLQMEERALTAQEVSRASQSCPNSPHDNLLSASDPAMFWNKRSVCDDVDGCADSPCGEHGTCIDLQTDYRCECDPLWSGVTCEIPPDFCTDHQCANGASCANTYQYNNYSCQCSEDFIGALCQEPVVHGGWGEWSEFGPCSATCNNGIHSRDRVCDSPIPGVGGRTCSGESRETEPCNSLPCPVDGKLAEWSSWSCPVTCGGGTANRVRSCIPPENGGRECEGALVDYTDCASRPCPVAGNYSSWEKWSSCSASCGKGLRTRVRTCTEPPPQHGGANCERLGVDREEMACNSDPCPSCPPLLRNSGQTLRREHNSTSGLTTVWINCPWGYMVDIPYVTCGPETGWIWSHVTVSDPRGTKLPQCTKMLAPKERLIRSTANIEDVNEDDDVETAIQRQATVLTQCYNPCEILVASTPLNGNRRKRNAGHRFTRSTVSRTYSVTMSVPPPAPGTDLTTASDSEMDAQIAARDVFEVLAENFVNHVLELFNITVGGRSYSPDLETLTGEIIVSCPVGYQASGGACIECGPGTFWKANVCHLCPLHHYQDLYQQAQCKDCPRGTTTLNTGSQSQEDCLGKHADDGSSDGINTGLIVGMAIAGVALTLLLLSVFCCWKKLCRRPVSPRPSVTPMDDPPPVYTAQRQAWTKSSMRSDDQDDVMTFGACLDPVPSFFFPALPPYTDSRGDTPLVDFRKSPSAVSTSRVTFEEVE